MSAPGHDAIARAAAAHGLNVMGGAREDGGTVILLGPSRDFWPLMKASAEMQDGRPDPIDRWSRRVIGDLAGQLGAEALFPFGGPPYLPFLRWAMESGRAWQSPAGMLVHDVAGLMVSYRGALRFAQQIDLPRAGQSPCVTCADKPCLTACPVDALSAARGYDVAACHRFLDTPPGQDCMTQGCKARRACPVSQSFARDPEQSAFHMRYFHR
ncbi:ferredoxin [Pelagivirga sediminicola]|uniref:Ferredoxin n=1 Tax=Pelagivirga sediminicola TaxID=2170575 RepID=A0A2T7G6W3_9RHOB|nr:ferredoxin [Pelagivirga sediminicola]PVA10175.1 ferredoxin [Pelagivirga sediminicola]